MNPAVPVDQTPGAVVESMDGAELRARRLKAHWTQRELANKLSVSVRTVRSWEAGQVPSLKVPVVENTLNQSRPEGAPGPGLPSMSDATVAAIVVFARDAMERGANPDRALSLVARAAFGTRSQQ